MRAAFLGFGLIGGSMARALRARDRGGWSLSAWTPNGDGPRAAAAEGTIDVAATHPADAVRDADLVVLAASPLDVLTLLDRLAEMRSELPSSVVITDVVSTKRRIVERADHLGLPFVGGHPMAGRETTGYRASDPELFVDRPWVICDSPSEAGIARVESLARATGARPVRMDAATHDAAVALVSHVPLVVSAAIVEAAAARTPAELESALSLAAGGWAGMTRLARGDVAMGTGIVATNGDLVAERLRELRGVIDLWLQRLEADDPGPIRDAFTRARSILDEAQ
jgi:prephenate dehydrogenase